MLVLYREKRKGYDIHPRTPDPYSDCSKRTFDGKIRAWRIALHQWDNQEVRPDLDPSRVGQKRKKETTTDQKTSDGGSHSKKPRDATATATTEEKEKKSAVFIAEEQVDEYIDEQLKADAEGELGPEAYGEDPADYADDDVL